MSFSCLNSIHVLSLSKHHFPSQGDFHLYTIFYFYIIMSKFAFTFLFLHYHVQIFIHIISFALESFHSSIHIFIHISITTFIHLHGIWIKYLITKTPLKKNTRSKEMTTSLLLSCLIIFSHFVIEIHTKKKKQTSIVWNFVSLVKVFDKYTTFRLKCCRKD